MKNLTKYVFFILILTCIFVTTNHVGLAQQVDSTATSAVQIRGDSPDVNIDVDRQENINKRGSEIEAPAIKGGETGERAASRFVNFDNWTGLYIKAYIDGYYQGTVAPWGNLKIYVTAGYSYRLYARADFDDGTHIYWGARDRYFGNSFNWRLNP